MVVTISRPYFSPYPGYLYKAELADVLVILDRVQFPRKTTWINRNRFKNDQGMLWLTVPARKKHLGLQPIDRVRINNDGRWHRKHLKSLQTAYRHAPYFAEHAAVLEAVFSGKIESILEIDLALIRYLFKAFRIGTQIVLQSELEVVSAGDRLLVESCRRAGGTRLLLLKEVHNLVDMKLFEKSGIEPVPLQVPHWVYPQLWGGFLSNLSAFDLLFNCGPKSRDIMLGR